MKPPSPAIEDHFQVCISQAFARARRLDTLCGIPPNKPLTICRGLETPERWVNAVERVRSTFYTRRSVDRISTNHRHAWSTALAGDELLMTHSFLRGDTVNLRLMDFVTETLIRRAEGNMVLATPSIPWIDRLAWPIRPTERHAFCDQAWRHWRFGEIVYWLTEPVTALSDVQAHLSLLIGSVLAHFGEEFAVGNGPETAAHWLNLLDALGDGIMPVAYSSRAKTFTLARWQDLESRPLPS